MLSKSFLSQIKGSCLVAREKEGLPLDALWLIFQTQNPGYSRNQVRFGRKLIFLENRLPKVELIMADFVQRVFRLEN